MRFTWKRLLIATMAAAAATAASCSDSPTADPARALLGPSASMAPSGYSIADLGTLGGSFSIAFDVSDAGIVAGAATIPGEYQHPFLWYGGSMHDLGTFGGPNAPLNTEAGGTTGAPERPILGETGQADLLDENFCGFGTGLVCRAGVWRNGVVQTLPGLGGINSAALTSNNGGQIVGVADDGVLDATCLAPQRSHFQAVAWENGQARVLPPLPGDEVAMAARNNDSGQVVGTSGLCSNTGFGGTGFGAHAVMWDRGTPIRLGDLGDPNAGFAATINNHGEVFGAAGYADGSIHPFRWTRATGMQDLGLMSSDPADAQNTPFYANDRGQMVGSSCDVAFGACRGYIWRDGVFTDLNSLLPAGSSLYIILPLGLNQSGQIAGLAVDMNTGEAHAFLATPHATRAGVSASVASATSAVGPASASMASHAASRPPMPAGLRRLLMGRHRGG